MVVDSEGDIYDCSTGDIFQSFYCLINSANKIYSSPVPQKADIVVTVARNPLNKNLYQSQKAIESAKLAVKKGGVIILVSSCNEGIGPANFYYLLKESSNPQYIFEKINKEYKLGYHKTAKLIEASFISDLFIVTNLNSKLFEGTFIKSYNSLEVAIKDALDKLGEKAKILLLMDGALISPLIKEYKYNQV